MKRRLDIFQPSASYSALILSPCNHWRRVGAEWYDDTLGDTSKRDSGTRVHDAIHKSWSDPMFKPSLTDEEADMVRAANAIVTKYMKAGGKPLFEVAMGMEPSVTGQVYGSVSGRDYPTDGLMHGSADLIVEQPDGSVVVLDWKTGGGAGARKQLLTLASAYYMATGKAPREFKLVVCYLGDDAYMDEITVDHLTLEAHMEKLTAELARQPGEPVIGPHCTQFYCPHMAYCSAVSELDKQLGEHNVEFKTDPENDTEAGEMMNAIRMLKRRADYFTAAMKRYVDGGGKPEFGDEVWDRENSKGYYQWRAKK
jgi:hypothetical protein